MNKNNKEKNSKSNSLVDLADQVFDIKTCCSCSKILDKMISKGAAAGPCFDIILKK